MVAANKGVLAQPDHPLVGPEERALPGSWILSGGSDRQPRRLRFYRWRARMKRHASAVEPYVRVRVDRGGQRQGIAEIGLEMVEAAHPPAELHM
jgi:hypothetical protein